MDTTKPTTIAEAKEIVRTRPEGVTGMRSQQSKAAAAPRNWSRMLSEPEWQPGSPKVRGLRLNRVKFSDPQQLEDLIDEYIDDCTRRDVLPTVSGISLALGLQSRITSEDVMAYGVLNDALASLLKYAMLRISTAWEERLGAPKQAIGAIFWLKNHGWMDERTQRTNMTVTHQVQGYWEGISQQVSAERVTIDVESSTLGHGGPD